MARPKTLFHRIEQENQALTADIHGFVLSHENSTLPRKDGQEDPDEPQLKVLLERLYVAICDFGKYQGPASTPDRKIIAGWESFLDPIRVLAKFEPHGRMMAARMVLYLTSAFLGNCQLSCNIPMHASSARPIALRCNFLIALDDTLLSQLTQIWSNSDKRETFPWVFAEYVVQNCSRRKGCHEYLKPGLSLEDLHEQRRRDRFKAACLTRPSELTPENGLHRRRRWTRPKGDTTGIYPRDPDCVRCGTKQSDTDTGPVDLLMWQDINGDGPIRETYNYNLIDEDTQQSHWRGRPALRRSLQFVLDARKIAEVYLATDRRRLAEIAMARSPLPVELEVEVLSYLEVLEPHPHLSKLDLSAAYRPFPDLNACSGCRKRGSNSSWAKGTCPNKTLTVWSLPLRMFHTFHLRHSDNATLCLQHDCGGHHVSGQEVRLSQGEELEKHLDEALQRRCGPGTTVESLGLGPWDEVEDPTVERDGARDRGVFHSRCDDDFERDDVRAEAHWSGITGLVDVMLHGRTLVDRSPLGHSVTDDQWMLGRTRQDERKVREGLMSKCGYRPEGEDGVQPPGLFRPGGLFNPR